MFDNIGGKIKTLAKVLCWIGIIASLALAIVLWSQNNQYDYVTRTRTNTIGAGLIVLVVGCLGSWVGSFFMYGFGELIENTAAICEMLKPKGEPEMKPMITMAKQISDDETKPVAAPAVEKPRQVKGWTCVKCHCLNSDDQRKCASCGEEKVRIATSSWVCKWCGLRNSAGAVCEDCGRSKE